MYRNNENIMDRDRRRNKICCFFNNGDCKRSGCKYDHVELPYCKDDPGCRTMWCPYKHRDKQKKATPSNKLRTEDSHRETRKEGKRRSAE